MQILQQKQQSLHTHNLKYHLELNSDIIKKKNIIATPARKNLISSILFTNCKLIYTKNKKQHSATKRKHKAMC